MNLILNQNSKEEILQYLQEQFQLDYSLNLDSLYDVLSTCKEEINIYLEEENQINSCILLVFADAQKENPYLLIHKIINSQSQD
ncbi:hypothetical protein [Floccifex sp.]|uniref:hypothetical protein n=1 Tax=Floccifex sp. TaxID=2815810 RepID=UPI003F04C673